MNSIVRVGGGLSDGQYRLLVPITDDDTSGDIERRLQTAAAIARERGGGLVVAYIVTLARQTPLDAVPADDPVLTEAREAVVAFVEFAEERDVPATGRIHLTREESRSVLDAVEEYESDGVILAVETESQRRRLLGGAAAEKIVARAGCEVFVEKQAADETPIEHILLAVSGGPHSGLAAKTARALALDADAHIDAIHFLDEDATEDEQNDGEKIIEATERVLFGVEQVEAAVERAENVAETIIARSDEYDVTVLGSPTAGLLSQFVFGTVPDSVNQQSENAVVMAQQDTASTSVYDRWIAGDPTE